MVYRLVALSIISYFFSKVNRTEGGYMAYRKRQLDEVKIPVWAKMARKKMLDRRMTVKELTEAIGLGYTEVSAAMNGTRDSKRVEVAVKQFFGFETR